LTYSQTPDTIKLKRVIITTSLLDYFPTLRLNTGNFNIGSEIYIKNRKSFCVNFGIIKSYGQSSGLISINSQSTQGMKIQVEARHYLNRRKIFEPAIFLFWPHIFQYKSQTLQNTGYYVAIHSSYQWTATDREETVIDYIDNNPFPNTAHYRQNIYTVDRNVYGLNLKFGYQCIKKYGLTIDYGVGLGVQYISSSSKNRIGNDFSWPNSERDHGNKLFDKGTGIAPNFLYQVRLGWAL
jgi:hypothetical protein